MVRPRPVSAGKSLPTAPPISTYHEPRIEQALLHKIGLLAEHHERNAQALRALRSISTPPTAWAGVVDPPPPYETVSPGRTKRRVVSNDKPKMNRACPARPSPSRAFTRVTASSGQAPWRNKPTVVEPFHGMETHATAWKRKMRRFEEVGPVHVIGYPDGTTHQLHFETSHHIMRRFLHSVDDIGSFSEGGTGEAFYQHY